MKILLVCFLFFGSLYSYTNPELEALWASLSEVNDPTLEDYRLVERYLKYGKRPYLENIYKTSFLWGWPLEIISRRLATWRNFKLVGPNGEMPICEIHPVRLTEKTKDRCILIYASYNHSYPRKLVRILEELKQCGYSGNVMVRIGGFPNLSEGGLKSCPFFLWKQEFIKEALRNGFTKVVHLDTSMHPLTDMNSIFDAMETKGYYLMYSKMGSLQYLPTHAHVDHIKFPPELSRQIPWLPGYIVGFNLSHAQGAKLFSDWDTALRKIDEFICLGWDEVVLTTLAWQNHLEPIDSLDHRVYISDSPPINPHPSWLFFFDTTRN